MTSPSDMEAAWNSLCEYGMTKIIAESEELDERLLDVERSAVENGMSSIEFIRSVQELKRRRSVKSKSDSGVDFEEFGERPLKDFASVTSLEELLEANPIKNYRVADLTDAHAPESKKLVAQRFMEKAEFERYSVNFEFEDYYPFLDSIWRPLTKNRMSFVVIDESQRLRAVAFCGDFVGLENSESSEEIHPHLHNVFACLNQGTERAISAANEVIKEGDYMEILMVASASDTSGIENVGLIYLIEKEILRRAKANGFRGVLAQNTNPVTQKISELLGYKCMCKLFPKTFVNSAGEMPFEEAPDTFMVTIDMYSFSEKSRTAANPFRGEQV